MSGCWTMARARKVYVCMHAYKHLYIFLFNWHSLSSARIDDICLKFWIPISRACATAKARWVGVRACTQGGWKVGGGVTAQCQPPPEPDVCCSEPTHRRPLGLLFPSATAKWNWNVAKSWFPLCKGRPGWTTWSARKRTTRPTWWPTTLKTAPWPCSCCWKTTSTSSDLWWCILC